MKIMKPGQSGRNTDIGIAGLKDLISDFPSNFIMAEIGCYVGESTSLFAAKASKIYAIDPWVDYIDKSATNPWDQKESELIFVDMTGIEEKFDKAASQFRNIVKLKGASNVMVSQIPDCSLDVVYIDGNHCYSSVFEDICLWISKLKPDGIISGHDCNFRHVAEAVTATIGAPHKTYSDFSWAKRLPSNLKEYKYVTNFVKNLKPII